MNKTVEIVSEKFVRQGPHLWVSKLLHQRGPLSTNKIWEEFIKDSTVEKDLIKSKSFLKERILHQMMMQGKIARGKAVDLPQYNKAGWALVPNHAFRNTAPDVLANMQPIPAINRYDYKEFLRNNNIPFDF